MRKIILGLFILTSYLNALGQPKIINRTTVVLNGQWGIAKTTGELPQQYTSKVAVPGLVDMAIPALDTLGCSYKNGWYWYRRSFQLKSNAYDLIQLKIFKAKYHTKVYVNKKMVGENFYCFTPSYYDLKPYLNSHGQANEIVIGVGNLHELPDTIPNGSDYEKLHYIPGIYDNVELSLSNKPFISNVQVAPDVINKKLRVVAEILTDNYSDFDLNYVVKELKSGKVYAKGIARAKKTQKDNISALDFEIDMNGSHLWTPEIPFLYNLSLITSGDKKETRFGMRSFRFDPVRKIALLNEQPYYSRGTNVTIFRFFEDQERAGLPWDNKWVIDLHKKFKDMHWNGMRYCIGYPPERWYEIADSLGFIIQDEYPLWGCSEKIKARHLAYEYSRRMRESWNHPSIVIWDAQNETLNEEIGKAIQMCRHLDLSNRPWQNGWDDPQSPTDPLEAHPYFFGINNIYGANLASNKDYLKFLLGVVRRPHYDVNTTKYKDSVVFNNPTIINEYEYNWLNRDGTPTTLTDSVYVIWGKNLTTTERRKIYAKHLAMITEYWRAHRQATAIYQFCGLGYSRSTFPRGQTSDFWIDIKNLKFDPLFYKYVRPAFSPIGLMIDNAWDRSYKVGGNLSFPIYVINDLGQSYNGKLKLTFQKNGKIYFTQQKEISIASYDSKTFNFNIDFPKLEGIYEMKAEIQFNGESVISYRDIKLVI